MANPKDSMRHSVMLAALQQIIALAPEGQPRAGNYIDIPDLYHEDTALWTAAEVARKALDTLSLPHAAEVTRG